MGKTRFFHLAKEIIMYFVILMMIPLIPTRKTDRIKRYSQQSDYDEYYGDYYTEYDKWWNSNYGDYSDYGLNTTDEPHTIVYDDYNYYDYPVEIEDPPSIVVQNGSVFSDDKVEIRLYGPNSEISEWFELTGPVSIDDDGFTRMSDIKTENHFTKITKVGIRKFGTDGMMIDSIIVCRLNDNGVYDIRTDIRIDQWIKKEEQEYIFEALSFV